MSKLLRRSSARRAPPRGARFAQARSSGTSRAKMRRRVGKTSNREAGNENRDMSRGISKARALHSIRKTAPLAATSIEMTHLAGAPDRHTLHMSAAATTAAEIAASPAPVTSQIDWETRIPNNNGAVTSVPYSLATPPENRPSGGLDWLVCLLVTITAICAADAARYTKGTTASMSSARCRT